MHSWIGYFNSEIADPFRSDPGVSDLDLDPIQIHKNRIFDPDRGSFRSDHYITDLPKVIALSIPRKLCPPFFAFVCLIGMQVVWLQDKVDGFICSQQSAEWRHEPRRLETGFIF